jgi:hypothetical protein
MALEGAWLERPQAGTLLRKRSPHWRLVRSAFPVALAHAMDMAICFARGPALVVLHGCENRFGLLSGRSARCDFAEHAARVRHKNGTSVHQYMDWFVKLSTQFTFQHGPCPLREILQLNVRCHTHMFATEHTNVSMCTYT